MGDGRVRHVHANKMHKFHARVQGCNVISECDDDIGRVLVPVTVPCDVLPSAAIGHSKIEHLNAEQQTELMLYFVLSEFCIFVLYFHMSYWINTSFGPMVLVILLCIFLIVFYICVECEFCNLPFGTYCMCCSVKQSFWI